MTHSLFLIEDEPLLCELFGEFISSMPEIEYLGDARDGSEAMQKLMKLQPDILILDLRIPEVNGLEILTLMRRKKQDTKVIIFSGSLSEETLRITLEHKASGYIEKACGLDELEKAIHAAMKGEKHFSPGVQKLLDNYRI